MIFHRMSLLDLIELDNTVNLLKLTQCLIFWHFDDIPLMQGYRHQTAGDTRYWSCR